MDKQTGQPKDRAQRGATQGGRVLESEKRQRSHCCSPWQFAKKKTLTLHKVGPCPSLNGKAIAELRPIRSQSPLTHSKDCSFMEYNSRMLECLFTAGKDIPRF